MDKPVAVRVVVRRGDAVLGVRPEKQAFFGLPAGMSGGGVEPEDAARGALSILGLEPDSVAPAGLYSLRQPKEGPLVVDCAAAFVADVGDAEPECPDGTDAGWASPSDFFRHPDGLLARRIFNALGVIRRPELDLEELYRITKAAYDGEFGEDASGRMARVTAGVDLVIDEISFLDDSGHQEEIDRILGEADVARIHADILDAAISCAGSVLGLSNYERFRDEAEEAISMINEKIPKKRSLTLDGAKVTDDVRGEAARRYQNQAKRLSGRS